MNLPRGLNLPHIAARVFNAPLLIEPEKARTILGVLAPRILGADPTAIAIATAQGETSVPAPVAAVPFDRRRRQQLQILDGVAVIDVFGTLVHRASFMEAMSGLTGYEQLSAEFNTAIDDPAVQGILMRVDSPGGEVYGVFDLADQIFAARKKKPVWAIAEDVAASAAYLIASSAEKLFVTQSAFTGSVGVLTYHLDWSEAEKQMGVKVTELFAGAHKIDGSPHRPLSDSARAWIQGVVDNIYSDLVAKVARNRGIDAEAVRATEARVFQAADSVARKFADGISTAAETYAALQQEISSRQVRGNTISMTSNRAEDESMSESATKTADPQPAGAGAVEEKDQAVRAAAEAERDRILKIEALTLPGYEQLAVKAKADGTTPEAFAVLQAEEQKKRAKAKLSSIREDEAGLEVPEPGVAAAGAGVTDEAQEVRRTLALYYAAKGLKQPAA